MSEKVPVNQRNSFFIHSNCVQRGEVERRKRKREREREREIQEGVLSQEVRETDVLANEKNSVVVT